MGDKSQSARAQPGTLLVLIAAVLWGTTGTAAEFAPSAGPIAIGAAAMGVGGLLQAIVAIRPIRRDVHLLRRHPRLVLLGAVAVAIYPLAFYAGMHLAGVAVGTVVALASGPIFAAVLERVIDGATLDSRWLVSAALGIAGTALLTVDGATNSDSRGTVPGVILALVAGATYAVYTWAARRVMNTGARSRAAMGAIFGCGGLLLVPVLLIAGAPFVDDPRNLAAGAYLAIVPMFLGYLAFGAGLRSVSARAATVLTLAEPAVAALLAWAVLGERVGVLGIAGLVCVAGSLTALSLPKRQRR